MGMFLGNLPTTTVPIIHVSVINSFVCKGLMTNLFIVRVFKYGASESTM